MQGAPNQNYFRFYFLNLKLFFFLNLVFNVESFMGLISLIRYFHIDVTQKPYLTSALVIVKVYNLNKKPIIWEYFLFVWWWCHTPSGSDA